MIEDILCADSPSGQDVIDKISEVITQVNTNTDILEDETDWVDIDTFDAGFVADVTRPPQQKRVRDIVYLRGRVNRDSTTIAGTTPQFAILGEGFEPASFTRLNLNATTSASGLIPANLQINALGGLIIQTNTALGTGSSNFFSLDGLFFHL